jgi:hypothetical protein
LTAHVTATSPPLQRTIPAPVHKLLLECCDPQPERRPPWLDIVRRLKEMEKAAREAHATPRPENRANMVTTAKSNNNNNNNGQGTYIDATPASEAYALFSTHRRCRTLPQFFPHATVTCPVWVVPRPAAINRHLFRRVLATTRRHLTAASPRVPTRSRPAFGTTRPLLCTEQRHLACRRADQTHPVATGCRYTHRRSLAPSHLSRITTQVRSTNRLSVRRRAGAVVGTPASAHTCSMTRTQGLRTCR